MSQSNASFRATFLSLWLRSIMIGVIGTLFLVVPQLPGWVQNWRRVQSLSEIVFGITARLIFAAVLGAALATLYAVVAGAPMLVWRSSRERIARVATAVAVAAVVLIDLSAAAKIVVTPLMRLAGIRWFPTTIVFTLAFLAALCIPRRRRQIVSSMDAMLSERATRRTALATGIAAAGLIASEFAIGKVASAGLHAARTSRTPGPNILFISFDALSAEDMSVYGYRLPTTPRLAELAATSSVFTNFYSVSTVTTPGVASILTGLYPSEHRVYWLDGRLRREDSARALPRLMREAGYATGASISNPFAYLFADTFAADFDVFPEPVIQRGFDLWQATGLLHQRQPYSERGREYLEMDRVRLSIQERLEKYDPHLFAGTTYDWPPAACFAQAREVIDRLPEGFFMWVHIMAPHGPYLPDAPWLGRRLPLPHMMNTADEDRCPSPRYPVRMQPLIDQARLRYDELLEEADSYFGSFLSGLESAGRLRNTAVIVTSDHGESFEGGVFAHDTQWLTRQGTRVPLIVHLPGQNQPRRIDIAADQTALAPTILDLAGAPSAASMRGRPLRPWLTGDAAGEDRGLAFTQYLAANSAFEPLRTGSAAVVDGSSQYVLDLATGSGMLRGLSEANLAELDRSQENPSLAQTLRNAIYQRFPELPRNRPSSRG